MSGALLAGLGALGGALVTALASLGISLYQHRSVQRSEHRQRAFERHLAHYERIFITAHSTQDAFGNLRTVSQRAADRSDPFLGQMLAIVADQAKQFCLAVDWQHNPGMAYLDIGLEQKCLHVRDLLLNWLSRQRITSGDIAFVHTSTEVKPVPLRAVHSLKVGDYRELRIERRIVVTIDTADLRQISHIHVLLASVITELKKVMSY